MLFEIGHMSDGNLVLMSDGSFPSAIKRVVYYRDQRLFMLDYEDQDHDGFLIEYEVSDFADDMIKRGPGNILVVNAGNPKNLEGFDVPLIQVGV
jgi:hypothetical protein